jgi:hypothetical protein
MSFLVVCLVVGLIVLYPPVRRVIFQGVWAIIVGAVVIFLLVLVLIMLTGATPIMPDDCLFSPQADFCRPWIKPVE